MLNFSSDFYQYSVSKLGFVSKIEVMKVMQTMKQRAKAEVTSIPTIYEEELIKLRTPEWNDDTRQTSMK
jgi:hypothetical protein